MSEQEKDDPGPPRVRLEYFAADLTYESGSRRYRPTFCWTALAIGWLPFTCGVISSQAVANSGVEETVTVHHHAGAAFMACGMVISLSCIISFLRASNKSAAFLATLMLLMQICLFACVGAAGIR